jgi:hypothetical protein
LPGHPQGPRRTRPHSPPLFAGEKDELAEKDAEIARLKTQLSEFTVVA